VGVFVDAPLEEVNRAVARIGLKAVQLHGAETPEYAARVKAERVIKAFRVGPGFDDARIDDYPECLILLDAHVEGVPGGTGRAFEWDLARKAWERAPIILAGGLNPDNVEEAIRAVKPMAVDVSSGVEARPGEKDPNKLRMLFQAIARSKD
jgi:phosphoribosylanthranilate isomerase